MVEKNLVGKIDWLALDLDGTVLNSKKQVPDSVVEAVEMVKAADVMPFLITGRPRAAVFHIYQQLRLTTPMVCSNGGTLYDPPFGEVEHYKIADEQAQIVLQLLSGSELSVFYENSEGIFTDMEPDRMYRDPISEKLGIQRVDDLLTAVPGSVTKFSIVGDPERISTLLHKLQESNLDVTIVLTHPDLLEITHTEADKGKALLRLAERKGMALERLMVIGDGWNDLGMFRVAGYSAAMGNAPTELKELADFILPDNDRNGVAWAIRELILGQNDTGLVKMVV